MAAAGVMMPCMAAATGEAIRIEGLTKRFGGRAAVDGLSLEVRTGEVFGFLGPNGAGKTTTIRLLLGLLRPNAGTINVLGHSMPAEHVAVLARTGYVPERPHLYPTLTVDEALRFHSAVHARW